MSEPIPPGTGIPSGTLSLGEPHPSAHGALKYVVSLGPVRQAELLGAFSSCALSGNRTAEILAETLRRVMTREPVSDRYVLGLAWYVRDMENPM